MLESAFQEAEDKRQTIGCRLSTATGLAGAQVRELRIVCISAYFRRPSFLIVLWYPSRFVLERYLSKRFRLPTIMMSPLREWRSCLCIFRCSFNSLIRNVRAAICTSGEPQSDSCLLNSVVSVVIVVILFLNLFESAILPEIWLQHDTEPTPHDYKNPYRR